MSITLMALALSCCFDDKGCKNGIDCTSNADCWGDQICNVALPGDKPMCVDPCVRSGNCPTGLGGQPSFWSSASSGGGGGTGGGSGAAGAGGQGGRGGAVGTGGEVADAGEDGG